MKKINMYETPIIIFLVVLFIGLGGALANDCDGDECQGVVMGGAGIVSTKECDSNECMMGGGATEAYIATLETSDKTTTQLKFIPINLSDIGLGILLSTIIYLLYLIYDLIKEGERK